MTGPAAGACGMCAGAIFRVNLREFGLCLLSLFEKTASTRNLYMLPAMSDVRGCRSGRIINNDFCQSLIKLLNVNSQRW